MRHLHYLVSRAGKRKLFMKPSARSCYDADKKTSVRDEIEGYYNQAGLILCVGNRKTRTTRRLQPPIHSAALSMRFACRHSKIRLYGIRLSVVGFGLTILRSSAKNFVVMKSQI